ncbi:MAG TPA: GtrA family protein [bacterium]|jgi:dolichol-phosphate mannosyltransferase|nr:GtrA family protein [bacterium]
MFAGTLRRLQTLSLKLDRRPARFVLVGASGFGVNLVVFWLATRVLVLPTLWAGVAAWAMSTGSNFLLNDVFTWGDRRRTAAIQWGGRLLRYYLTTLAGMVLYLVLLAGLVRMGMLDLLANIIAVGISGALNFLLHNAWTWRRQPAP